MPLFDHDDVTAPLPGDFPPILRKELKDLTSAERGQRRH
jgi:hypothetical protein